MTSDPDLATDIRNLRDVVTMLLRHQKAQDKAIAAIAKTVDKLAARERRNDVQSALRALAVRVAALESVRRPKRVKVGAPHLVYEDDPRAVGTRR